MSERYTVQLSADQSSPWKTVFTGALADAREEFRRVLGSAKRDAAVRLVQPSGAPMMLAFAQPKRVKVAPTAKPKKQPTKRAKKR